MAEASHAEYKYELADGTGHVQWSTVCTATLDFDDVKYVAEYNRQGQHKTQTIIDSPAVQAVDGVTCVTHCPVDTLTDASDHRLRRTNDTAKFTWHPHQHRLFERQGRQQRDGRARLRFDGSSILTSKVFTLDGPRPSRPARNRPDPRECHRPSWPRPLPVSSGRLSRTTATSAARSASRATPAAGRVFGAERHILVRHQELRAVLVPRRLPDQPAPQRQLRGPADHPGSSPSSPSRYRRGGLLSCRPGRAGCSVRCDA